MAAHSVDSSFRLPDLIAIPAHPDVLPERESGQPVPGNALAPFRGLGFALLFEAAVAIIGCTGFELWRLLR
jgi:hypothetical protein